MELLIMIESFKRASADRITAVIPYFGYARQDRKDEGRVPITAKLVANLITRAGADRVLAMDLHAAQIQGFFDIPVDHLYAAPVIDKHFMEMHLDKDEIVVVSPDEGSIKRALKHVAALDCQLAIVDKRRTSADKTKQANLIGGPDRRQGRPDLRRHDQHRRIDLRRRRDGASGRARGRSIWRRRTASSARTPSSESTPPRSRASSSPTRSRSPPIASIPKIKTLSVAPLLGEAIKRIHRNESVSRLFDRRK